MALRTIAGGGLLGLVVVPFPSCGQAIMTAPPGSTLVLDANPLAIPAFGGVSVITAIVTEPTGTAVPDGTVVQFFTSLGRIDEQGRTNDGVARVNLTSDGRSGLATVTAYSGGNAASSGTGTTGGGSASAITDDIEVTIGALRAERVAISANPSVLAGQRWTSIAATVYDAQGDPLSGIPVHLTVALVDGGPAAYESLDSGGAPLYTDNNGRVLDRMQTSYPPEQPRRSVKVTATTSNGKTESVVVQINTAEAAPTVAHILVVANPTSITAATSSRITAYARAADGTPIPGVGLIFTVTLTAGGPTNETLASGSRPVTTGADGDARDTLRTIYVGPPSRSVTVTVTAPNGTTGSVAVLIN